MKFKYEHFLLQIFIAAFALVYGDPLRLVNGYDSFGNVCGSSNADMADHNDSRMSLSGYDTTDRRYIALINILLFNVIVIVIFIPLTDMNILLICLLVLMMINSSV